MSRMYVQLVPMLRPPNGRRAATGPRVVNDRGGNATRHQLDLRPKNSKRSPPLRQPASPQWSVRVDRRPEPKPLVQLRPPPVAAFGHLTWAANHTVARPTNNTSMGTLDLSPSP